MNRVERLTGILLLLQAQTLTSEQIAARFEVSKRTVLRDIQALSEMGVPVIAVAGPGGGYSLPEDYLLAPLPLSIHEAFILLLSLSVIDNLPDAPFLAERTSLRAKLQTLLPQQINVDQMLSAVKVSIPERATAAPYLEALLIAVQEQCWLEIQYQSTERLSIQQVLPREILTENGYWYCRAYSADRQEERTYRVDRIQSVMLLEPPFPTVSKRESLPYDDPSHPQVSVRLTPRGVAYAESETHIAQGIQRNPDGSGLLAFRCPPSELAYFARFFAGLGAEAEVCAPVELQDRLVEIGEQMVNLYTKR
jgi:predicted DNA-binding transcriptional regulator YafY